MQQVIYKVNNYLFVFYSWLNAPKNKVKNIHLWYQVNWLNYWTMDVYVLLLISSSLFRFFIIIIGLGDSSGLKLFYMSSFNSFYLYSTIIILKEKK